MQGHPAKKIRGTCMDHTVPMVSPITKSRGEENIHMARHRGRHKGRK